MTEIQPDPAPNGTNGQAATSPTRLSEVEDVSLQRSETGMEEFDRVLGGGVVPGSVVLIGGEPGVGKSTLLLAISGILAREDRRVVYFSGEESMQQIKTRAVRMGIETDHLYLITMGNLADLKSAMAELEPRYLIVDSIQTVPLPGSRSANGSPAAMRNATAEIIDLAKTRNISVFIIGHITKEGQIAGPKTLEHMVDVVLYFQGELRSDLRVLRAEKNRFGPVNELGVFQMTGKGLTSVKDPSHLFYQQRENPESGVALYPTMSGMRAIVIEMQTLVSETPFVGNPRRIAVGFDSHRMAMLISIIEKKLKLPYYKSDVFLNVAGGITIKETAGDLAALSALISSYKNINLPAGVVFIGEAGLTGEIHPVGLLENRINEARRQGFDKIVLPEKQTEGLRADGLTLHPVRNVHELYNRIQNLD
jgi:DNA repair protein RadA/Sms